MKQLIPISWIELSNGNFFTKKHQNWHLKRTHYKNKIRLFRLSNPSKRIRSRNKLSLTHVIPKDFVQESTHHQSMTTTLLRKLSQD